MLQFNLEYVRTRDPERLSWRELFSFPKVYRTAMGRQAEHQDLG